MSSTTKSFPRHARVLSFKQQLLRPITQKQSSKTRLWQVSVNTVAEAGVVYATSTGNTRQVAWLIKQCLALKNDPVDVATLCPQDLTRYNEGLIIGAPTWATAREDMRTGTAMDDLLWRIRMEYGADLLSGIPFAVFGCGDSALWPENFADGIDEVYTTLLRAGGTPVGLWNTSASGEFQHVQSKSYRKDGYFVGLPVDNVDQPDSTCLKVQTWCVQLRKELGLGIPREIPLPSATEIPAVRVPVEQPFLTADWITNDTQGYLLFGRRLGGGWYQVGGGSSAAGRWIKFTDNFLLMRAGLRGQPEYHIEYKYILSHDVCEQCGSLEDSSSNLVAMILRLDPDRFNTPASSSVGLWGGQIVLTDMLRHEIDGLCSFLRLRGAPLT